MGLSFRVSSTSSGGAANAVSLGGYASSEYPSTTNGAFFDDVTQAQCDTGHTDYRCVFIYNSGSTVMNNVTVTPSNKGGGSTVTVAASSTATGTYASYNTAVIASETTAPSITGSFGTSVNIGTLTAGQVKAVWLKRVTAVNAAASTNDNIVLVVGADEVVVP